MKDYTPSRYADEDHGDAEPALVRDVAFNRRSFGMDTHKSPLDNNMIQIGTDGIEVRLVKGVNEEGFGNLLRTAERATIGWTPETLDSALSPDEGHDLFQGGLQTALEGEVIAFAVFGVSRTATHQIVRSRRAFFHQSSQRASDLGMAPEFRMPESVWRAPEPVYRAWLTALNAAHQAYRAAADADVSFQDARFILPEGTTNFIQCAYTIREFINVYNYRACSMFQWEIVRVMRLMKDALVAAHPWIEPHIKISCERTTGSVDWARVPSFVEQKDTKRDNPELAAKLQAPDSHKHTCTFQGWEEVEHQCPFAWARESNRTYQPSAERKIRKQK